MCPTDGQVYDPAETIAFNAGVRTARDHARRIAQAIEARSRRPLADSFAVEALNAFADEGRALLLPCPELNQTGMTDIG